MLATTDRSPASTIARALPTAPGSCAPKPRERGDNLVIISFQVHRFKTVNDQHGYETGDRLLQDTAGALTEAARPDAVIARLSGDEFAVALAARPATTCAEPTQLAEAVLGP